MQAAQSLSGARLNSTGNSMSEYEFTISLRIRHPSIDPRTITQTLGIDPQHTWKAGDPRRSAGGEARQGAYRESYWMGRLMPEPELSSGRLSVESVLLQTLAQLRRSHSFLQQLSSDGGIAEVHVSRFVRETFRLDLTPETLGLLGRLGLAVALEIHPHSPHDVAPATAS